MQERFAAYKRYSDARYGHELEKSALRHEIDYHRERYDRAMSHHAMQDAKADTDVAATQFFQYGTGA